MHETLQTMNITDEDVNLGLAMGSTNFKNYSIRTRFINSSGAGVNADSRNNLAFAASDPLSELVWSPRKGLSLKRANSSAADEKPLLLWNVGPGNNGPSPSQIMWPEGNQDINAVDQGSETISPTMLLADGIFVDEATLVEPLESCEGVESDVEVEEDGNKDAIQKEENCLDDQEEYLCPSQNVQSAGIAGISGENADLQPQKEPENEATSTTVVVNENEIKTPISISSYPLKKPGPTAENGSCNLTEKDELPRENCPAVEGSQTESRICLYKAKGKEKALSDGDIYGRSLDDEDDSHESVESCIGTGIFPRGIKRQSYDEGVIPARKKMKIPGPVSAPVPKPDSSFMNWILNMVKGISGFNKEVPSSFPLPLASKAQDSADLNTGFQAVFQSLYCTDTNVVNTGVQKEINSIEESRGVMVDDKKSLENKQIITCGSNLADKKGSDSLSEQMNIAAEKASLEIPVATSDVPEKSNLRTSLWITRFCNKNPRSEKSQEIIQETIECSTYRPKIDLDSQMNAVLPTDHKSSETKDDSARFNSEEWVDLKSKSKLCPIAPWQKFSSEAMASVFARRLDALRHIMPSESEVKNNQKSPLCDIVAVRNTAAESEIFHAIKNLRLTRADIHRWMNSNASLSHLNGFFLRLRLGNLEAGLEGTSYYVACITGDATELNGCTSKKSILVDVGGIKSSVTSQNVSNHDFLEDEMKAWWCRIVDSGCKVPSLDELNSKLDDKKSLGF